MCVRVRSYVGVCISEFELKNLSVRRFVRRNELLQGLNYIVDDEREISVFVKLLIICIFLFLISFTE